MYTNLSTFLRFKCHRHSASHRCFWWIKLPQQIASFLFLKHHDVLYSFRIRSKLFCMASQALCVLALGYFFDLISCSLHPIIPEAPTLSFISETYQIHPHCRAQALAVPSAWKTPIPIWNDGLFLLINFQQNFHLFKRPFPSHPT